MFFRANMLSGFKSSVFVSNTQTSRRNFGDFLSVDDGFISFKTPIIESTQKKILHLSDIKFYNNKGRNDEDVLSLIKTMTERVKPDLVVITGDVIDKRFTGSGYKAFRNMIAPLVDLKQSWTYLPGNGEGIRACTRKELLNIFQMPYCASKGQENFTHLLDVGPLQVYLVDSDQQDLSNKDFIRKDPISWTRNSPFTKECGIAFLHHDNDENQPEISEDETEIFNLKKVSKWGKLVSENNKTWMYHGLFSGFSKPVEIARKERGGRVISFDTKNKILATWFETKKGIERQTIISKSLTVEERTSIVE